MNSQATRPTGRGRWLCWRLRILSGACNTSRRRLRRNRTSSLRCWPRQRRRSAPRLRPLPPKSLSESCSCPRPPMPAAIMAEERPAALHEPGSLARKLRQFINRHQRQHVPPAACAISSPVKPRSRTTALPSPRLRVRDLSVPLQSEVSSSLLDRLSNVDNEEQVETEDFSSLHQETDPKRRSFGFFKSMRN